MDDIYKGIGLRIRKLRNDKGYTRDQLSELAGISTKFLYEIEVGQKGLSAATLYRLSKQLSVSADYLLSGNVYCKNEQDLDVIIGLLDKNQIQLVADFISLLHR